MKSNTTKQKHFLCFVTEPALDLQHSFDSSSWTKQTHAHANHMDWDQREVSNSNLILSLAHTQLFIYVFKELQTERRFIHREKENESTVKEIKMMKVRQNKQSRLLLEKGFRISDRLLKRNRGKGDFVAFKDKLAFWQIRKQQENIWRWWTVGKAYRHWTRTIWLGGGGAAP